MQHFNNLFRQLIRLALLLFFVGTANAVWATTYFVSSESGDDSNDGSELSPFKTIAEAVKYLNAGDTLYLLEGDYSESVVINNLNGTASEPILIAAYPGENVVWRGTTSIEGEWEEHTTNIYKKTISEDIWQLFVDEKMMTSARWPNAQPWTDEMWDSEFAWAHQSDASEYGTMVDDGTKGLASTGKDFTGAMAVLNIGSWLSFTEEVTNHSANNDTFTYTTNFNENKYHHKKHHGKYFLEASLACLDTLNEWYFDASTKELYLYSIGSPEGKKIEGKTITYGLTLNTGSYVTVKDIDFFGCTVKMKSIAYTTLDNCHFLYPSYSKRMLKSVEKPEVTLFQGVSKETFSGNVIRNCQFEYADGSGLNIKGKGDLIENCFFNHIDYSAVGGLNDVMLNARETEDVQIRYTKLQWGGNSLGVKVGASSLVEYCEVSHIGYSQNDGSAIQASENDVDNCVFRYNWVHDCIKFALRFDSPFNNSLKWGEHGTMSHNVAWNSKPIAPKGDYHNIYNNTAFDNVVFDLSLFNDTTKGSRNLYTVTRNNAVGLISGHNGSKLTPYWGVVEQNWVGGEMSPVASVYEQLNDPANHDFRPKKNSGLIDNGYVEEGFSDNYIGAGPDIGAYEYGATSYWKAGLRFDKASAPIPLSEGTAQSEYVDLMWTEGYKADAHRIYFGTDETLVADATPDSPAYRGEVNNNIFTPSELETGTTYYWRVDVVRDGEITTGDVWSFSTALPANTETCILKVKVFGEHLGNIGLVTNALVRINGELIQVNSSLATARKVVAKGVVNYDIIVDDEVVYRNAMSVFDDKLTQKDTVVLANSSMARLAHPSEAAKMFELYPNPAHDMIKLSGVSAGAVLDVYHLSGQHVLSYEVSDEINQNIRIADLMDGVYLLEYKTKEGEKAIHRFVKI